MDLAQLVNWEFDVTTGMFAFNDRFYTIYGTTAELEGGYLMPATTYVREFVHPDDIPQVTAAIRGVASVTDPAYSMELEHRIVRRDGQVRYIIVRFGVIMDSSGRIIKTRGANQDITDRVLMESEIRSLNAVLEQRVKDRTEALSKANEALEAEIAQRIEAEKKLSGSLAEKSVLLKEIHHRVKNNLQIITSLLNLQSRYITDEHVLNAIRESQNRVKAMALVHERLYRSENIASISIAEYVKFLTDNLIRFYNINTQAIRLTVDIRGVNVDINMAIPLGLIFNELVSNSLKHAFPENRKGEIRITGVSGPAGLAFVIHDNGIGLPSGLDWKNTDSLGLQLVNSLVDQLDGTITLDQKDGTTFTILINKPPAGGAT
jgi:PAS domain S-box-containing protein